MNCQIAVLCDAATEWAGKLSLLGAFDALYTAQFPVTHAQCAVALRMTFTNVEEGPHKLRLNFVDEDGKFILPGIDHVINVAVPADTHFVTCNFVLTIQLLKFDKPGLYSIDVAVDGRQETSIPLLVKTAPHPPPTVAPR